MKSIIAALFFSMVFSLSIVAQSDSELKTVEISTDSGKSCFSFITESISCGKTSDIYYGLAPRSKEQNWFRASGEGTRNKIKRLGKKDWTDNFKVPVIEPYAKLRPGLARDPFLNASATRVRSMSTSDGTRNTGGASTFNERTGTFSDSKDTSDLPELKPTAKTENYFPFEKAAPGNMYVMRVVDATNDFYVLFRVDELEKGKRVKISWKRIEAPKED